LIEVEVVGELPLAVGQSSSSCWLQTADAARMRGVEDASWRKTLLVEEEGYGLQGLCGSTLHTSGTSFGAPGCGGRRRTDPFQQAFRSRIRMRRLRMTVVATGWGSRILEIK